VRSKLSNHNIFESAIEVSCEPLNALSLYGLSPEFRHSKLKQRPVAYCDPASILTSKPFVQRSQSRDVDFRGRVFAREAAAISLQDIPPYS
jgi:hypothetical protein